MDVERGSSKCDAEGQTVKCAQGRKRNGETRSGWAPEEWIVLERAASSDVDGVASNVGEPIFSSLVIRIR